MLLATRFNKIQTSSWVIEKHVFLQVCKMKMQVCKWNCGKFEIYKTKFFLFRFSLRFLWH